MIVQKFTLFKVVSIVDTNLAIDRHSLVDTI